MRQFLLDGEMEMVITVPTEKHKKYHGEYTIKPTKEVQVLPVSEMCMMDDITIEAIQNQNKTVKSGLTQQVIEPDEGFDGIDEITVEPITTETRTVKPTKQEQVIEPENAEYLSQVNIQAIENQEKTIKPNTTVQEVEPDEGFDGLDKVVVQAIQNQTKTVSPSNQTQTIEPDSGYDGLSQVVVNPVSLQTKTVKSTETEQVIEPDQGYTGFSQITVQEVKVEDKTVNPTRQVQVIEPDTNKDYLRSVVVNAIPNSYVDVSNDTVKESDVKTGIVFHKADGTQATGTYDAGWITAMIENDSTNLFDCNISDAEVIGEYAFYQCHSLRNATINTYNIGMHSFEQCENLETITNLFNEEITSLYTIGTNAFSNCQNLTTFNGIDLIEDFGNSCFSSCRKLYFEELGTNKNNSYILIRPKAFTACTSLEEINFKSNTNFQVDASYGQCFSSCSSLRNITFEKNVSFGTTNYVNRIFANCNALETVRLKGDVSGDYALSNLSNLKTVYFEQTPSQKTLGEFLFGNDSCDIYVPWSEGEVAKAPWGATGATIHYDTVYDSNGNPV